VVGGIAFFRYGWETTRSIREASSTASSRPIDVMSTVTGPGDRRHGRAPWRAIRLDKAKADPRFKIDYQRDWYHAPRTTRQCGEVAAGRKCVISGRAGPSLRFSFNPRLPLRAGPLRRRPWCACCTSRATSLPHWGAGERPSARHGPGACVLDSLFGKYQWPQLTNVHRIEGGGTEFPMMIMDGSAGIGPHRARDGAPVRDGPAGQQRVAARGGSNEGFSDFQEGWFFETHGGPAAIRRARAQLRLGVNHHPGR